MVWSRNGHDMKSPKRLIAYLVVGSLAASAAPARAQPQQVARPGELSEKSMSGTYRFYLGTLHAHSGYSGDHASTIATKFNKGVADYDRAHSARGL